MREVLHLQVGQCGNQVGAKVSLIIQQLIENCLLFIHEKDITIVGYGL